MKIRPITHPTLPGLRSLRTSASQSTHRTVKLTLVSILIIAALACSPTLVGLPWPTGATSTPAPVVPSPTPLPMADITFEVTLPAPLAAGETLAISLLDEVTGLALNAVNYAMQPKDAQTYTLTLPMPMNSVVKYRYMLLGGVQSLEDTSIDRPVRYRLYSVTGPGLVHDVVSSWTGRPFSAATGVIQGQVLNADTNAPIPNIMIVADGIQTLTDSGGRFYLKGLPPGTHNVVAYALDGAYQTFQQGATVGAYLATPVSLPMKPAPLVNVTFLVSVPANTPASVPVRLAGNLLQLGNTFGDLRGGLSTVADRMMPLTELPGRQYTLSLDLPVGADIRYKYTLGDGFWNAEHKGSGEFQLRQLIVPPSGGIIQDTVETWQAGPSEPIYFEVAVPPYTPAGDVIYIQFNPYDWTEPVPMWPLGNNRWAYKLFSPLNMLGSFGYRYCRSGQCGSADDVATAGSASPGRPVATSLTPENIQDTVTAWKWLQNTGPATLVSAEIERMEGGFFAAVEFQPSFHPLWTTLAPQALQNVQALGANWVVLTPTWSYLDAAPLVFAPLPGADPLWDDVSLMVDRARALNLNVAVFPVPHFPQPPANWWQNAPLEETFWQTWFDHYREFALYYADLASQHGAQVLILGGDWIGPALPGGVLSDGGSSNVPPDAESRWLAVLADVRAHFKGQLFWALPYIPGKLQNGPTFLSDVDGVYLLWDAPLSNAPSPTKEELTAEAGRLLDGEISLFRVSLQKPVILAVALPSVKGAASDCLPDGGGGCLDWMALSRPNPDIASVSLDLQAQEIYYEAMLIAVNQRAWVGGLVTRGYYPPTMLQDKSASVHGKPAADLLWYWFPRMLGVVQ